MAKVILQNIKCRRWVIKLSDQCKGRGHAYFDVDDLHEHKRALTREATWGTHMAFERRHDLEAIGALAAEMEFVLRKRAVMSHACKNSYGNWKNYWEEVLRWGEDSHLHVLASLALRFDPVWLYMASSYCGFVSKRRGCNGVLSFRACCKF